MLRMCLAYRPRGRFDVQLAGLHDFEIAELKLCRPVFRVGFTLAGPGPNGFQGIPTVVLRPPVLGAHAYQNRLWCSCGVWLRYGLVAALWLVGLAGFSCRRTLFDSSYFDSAYFFNTFLTCGFRYVISIVWATMRVCVECLVSLPIR